MGEITQLEAVGWIYRHENVVLIKCTRKEKKKRLVRYEKVSAVMKRHLGNERSGSERTGIHPRAGVGPRPRDH